VSGILSCRIELETLSRSGRTQLEATGLRVGRDPKFRELGLVCPLLWKESIWMLTVGVGGSAVPITKFGRVRKNRTLLSIPEREKKVAVERVDWHGTSKPEKNLQRAML